MEAKFEPLMGVIRIWKDKARYGDPYEWCATVRYFEPTKIEIMAYTKPVTPSMWKALYKECQRIGVTDVLAVTYPEGSNGPRKERWIKILSPVQKMYK